MSRLLVSNWPDIFARVCAALMRRGRSEHEAEDMAQEAWVRMASYERVQPIDNPEAFLMRTAINLSIDAHRARLTQGEEVKIDEVLLVDRSPSIEAIVLGKERLARLHVCLKRLTDKNRDIFLAHRLEGLTYQEVADRYGLSTSTVEKHVAKATAQMSMWMEEW